MRGTRSRSSGHPQVTTVRFGNPLKDGEGNQEQPHQGEDAVAHRAGHTFDVAPPKHANHQATLFEHFVEAEVGGVVLRFWNELGP